MDANVQELTAKAEKLNVDSGTPKYSTNWHEAIEGMWAATGRAYYNPKTDTNWCHLPMEMRSECIKWMDFETRMRMRRTSKTEKSLVESKKHPIFGLSLQYMENGNDLYEARTLYVSTFDKDEEPKKDVVLITKGDYQKTLDYAVQVLKYCEIENFYFYTNIYTWCNDQVEHFWPKLCEGLPFKIKNFCTSEYVYGVPMMVLKCSEGVENIRVRDRSSHTIDELIDLPSVINAKVFQYATTYRSRSLYELVQKWIDNDAKIGKILRFECSNREARNSFVEKFENRVISRTVHDVRIRTDNPSKHILLRCENTFYELSHFSCTIIASDLMELTSDKEWADELCDRFRRIMT